MTISHAFSAFTRATMFCMCVSQVSAQPAPPEWVAKSNQIAVEVLGIFGQHEPEFAFAQGVDRFRGQVRRVGPERDAAFLADLRDLHLRLSQMSTDVDDTNVQQDIRIMAEAVSQQIDGLELENRLFLPWQDTIGIIRDGISGVLNTAGTPSEAAAAVTMLRQYTGLAEGSTALTDQARAAFLARLPDSGIGPFVNEVERAIATSSVFVDDVINLFEEHDLQAPKALDALSRQASDYADWQKQVVLPAARQDFRTQPEYYSHQLRVVGIDVPPNDLIARASVAYSETQAMMQLLAPTVIQSLNLQLLPNADYREVIAALKSRPISEADIVAHYEEVNAQLEVAIRKAGIADLPQATLSIRLASPAESAAQPAPFMDPPPLFGNTGQRGTFVLPSSETGIPGIDDFSHSAAAWTLSAHEGRPGHELQFSAMVDRGVSIARALFAFNSVNAEGWALYAEAEMVPYEPVEGQFIALQNRLVRPGRAMLDPMLNPRLISPEDARRILTDDLVLSAPLVAAELDRYMFRSPGQAASYFYGYSRLLELRMRTEIAMGEAFDRLAFNNFILGQGLLPPDLLEQAVKRDFLSN